ncbi:hypothetical protein OF83DRAFT_1285434 [Amylostereum chailletii]|nr:hypothetical protein OF83DRAFT_1285434 [Amylostereum chailletii]
MATTVDSHPEALEKIFQKLEAESERRAREEEGTGSLGGTRSQKQRRRTSVSISRFGQVDDPSLRTTTFSLPSTPAALTTPPMYTASQHHVQSSDSLESTSTIEGTPEWRRESEHVTQVHRIAARQSISRSVGGILQRTLSRSRSKNSLTSVGIDNVIIGVVVEENATVEHREDEHDVPRPESRAMVYAHESEPAQQQQQQRHLRTQASRMTIAGGIAPLEKEKEKEKKGLMGFAAGLGRKLRARSQTVVHADGRPS